MGHDVTMTRRLAPATDGLLHTGHEPHLFRELVRAHQATMAAFSRRMGMPASRFGLLRLIATADRAAGVMDLSRQLGVNAAAVTRLVKELEADGLIRRRPHAQDARRHAVELTPKGVATFRQLHARSHELEQRLASCIAPAELARAASVLVRLRNLLEELT
jgi:DNA-binding MarR family transcriptional regulator